MLLDAEVQNYLFPDQFAPVCRNKDLISQTRRWIKKGGGPSLAMFRFVSFLPIIRDRDFKKYVFFI